MRNSTANMRQQARDQVLRLGTRGSLLARVQSRQVADELE
jgi:hypothetical protein